MLQPAELEALAGKALKVALAEEQYQRGVIIDGLNSQYLSLEMAANLLLSSLGLQKSCELPAPCLFRQSCCCHVPCSRLYWPPVSGTFWPCKPHALPASAGPCCSCALPVCAPILMLIPISNGVVVCPSSRVLQGLLLCSQVQVRNHDVSCIYCNHARSQHNPNLPNLL